MSFKILRQLDILSLLFFFVLHTPSKLYVTDGVKWGVKNYSPSSVLICCKPVNILTYVSAVSIICYVLKIFVQLIALL